MISIEQRIGRFTSSEIFKLMTKDKSGKNFGAPALTYIEEKRAERCLGRSLDTGAYSQDMCWGKVMETWAFENDMGIEYSLCSKTTLTHPKYAFWSGSPDFTKLNTAGEMKCYQPKKYYSLSKALLELNEGIISVDEFKVLFPDIYWQVVSNSILLNVEFCEIMAFTPSELQLMAIREEIEDTNFLERIGIEPWQGRFITEKHISELAYIPTHSKWPSKVIHNFKPTDEDKSLLIEKVIKAEEILNT